MVGGFEWVSGAMGVRTTMVVESCEAWRRGEACIDSGWGSG